MHYPNVTVIIPVLNEIACVESSLQSLFDCEKVYVGKVEFLLVDGGSTDGSLEMMEQISDGKNNVRLLSNPERLTPYALNLGIEKARFEVILRADAHALFHEEYIQNSVRCLLMGRGDNIGGILVCKENKSKFSSVLASLLNTPLGNGNARYRNLRAGGEVETVWCGCWYKSVLLKAGCFNPKWIRNQDAELNARLRSLGFKIYCSPDVRAKLVVRNDIMSFLRQYINYGKGRAMTMLKYTSSISLRQLASPFAVLILFALLILDFRFAIAGLIILQLLAIFMTRKTIQLENMGFVMLWTLPILVGMNLAWTSGLVSGFFQEIQSKIRSN